MTCRKKPEKNAGGVQVDKLNHKWEWEKVTWKKCNHCGFYHSNRFIPDEFWEREWVITEKFREKVGVILLRGNQQMWITESYHNCYGFPKGEKERDETLENCAKREFKEETGHSIDNINLNKCLKFTTSIENITYIFYVVHVPFRFDLEHFPEDDVEITSCGWVEVKDVGRLKLSKAIRKIYNLYIKHITEIKRNKEKRKQLYNNTHIKFYKCSLSKIYNELYIGNNKNI